MPAPHHPNRSEILAVLGAVHEETLRFLDDLDERPVRNPGADSAARRFDVPFDEQGAGALGALQELIDQGMDATIASAGPRFYHYVIGGQTPASLAADWWASSLDQLSSSWVTSPLAAQLEIVSLAWLRELFGLPAQGSGYITTGAMMANFTGLAAARQWWGHRHGVDVAQEGLHDLPRMPVFSSGYLHAASIKALAMLGLGRDAARKFERDRVGRLDLEALERALAELQGQPAVLIGNAGEVNAGDFDPIAEMADLAERYGAWLHVDGAFGLFAATSPRSAHLVRGVERAHSVTVDGHKWLNVPYDCGYSFVQDADLLAQTFKMSAAYLLDPDDPVPIACNLGPESSRRARSFATWATLRAYGKSGCREMVEGHLDRAQELAALVERSPELELLAPVPLNIVCFRYNPGGIPESELQRLNQELGQAILEDGRVYAGTTVHEGKVALRPAIVNWRTRPEDIELFVRVVLELATNLAAG